MNLGTGEKITWCPGCTNFIVLSSFKKAVEELIREKKLRKESVAIVAGIGCHAKLYDYLDFSAFYGLHGRPVPVAIGIKNGNPKLNVVVFSGDGDSYAEGISHFVHAARYNIDMTHLVINNQVFALTTGQATPTTEKGFKGKSTPLGSFEKGINPIAMALVDGATFVARASTTHPELMKELFKKAILHRGYAFVDVLQPCITFHNNTKQIREHEYLLKKHSTKDFNAAMKKALEWDGSTNKKSRIPLGIFYQKREKTYTENWPQSKVWHKKGRKIDNKKLLSEFL